MCLYIEIELPKVDKQKAGEITKQAKRANVLEIRAIRSKEKDVCRFFISENENNCACSLLGDNADWNLPTWEFRNEYLPRLVETIHFLSKVAANEITFQALWAGEKHWEDKSLKMESFLDIVSKNKIGTHAVYKINLSAG